MIAANDIEQAQKQIDEIESLKQTINGLLDLDDQRLRKIERLTKALLRISGGIYAGAGRIARNVLDKV